MSTTLKSDYQKLDPVTQQQVKQHLKKMAQTMMESSKAITKANGELRNEGTRNPKKLELINKEISDTMDSFRERLGVILDDMKHLSSNPQSKKEIERISEELSKPKMEKPDYQITNELKDLRDTIDPHAGKREFSRSPVQNNLLKRGTPKKNYVITTPDSVAKTPRGNLNKENSPVPTRKMDEPVRSRIYSKPGQQPVAASYIPSQSIRRLDAGGNRPVASSRVNTLQDPRRSNSASRAPQRQAQDPKAESSRIIRRLPANSSPNAPKPYYPSYNPTRLSPQQQHPSQSNIPQRKPLETSPMNPNVFRRAQGSTPVKPGTQISRSSTPQNIKRYTPSPNTQLSNQQRSQIAPITRPFEPTSNKKPVPSQPKKTIVRQPVVTSNAQQKDIELKPLARPKQKFNRKREIINSMSPVPRNRKSQLAPSESPSPKKKNKKTKKKKKKNRDRDRDSVSPTKVSPVEISPINNPAPRMDLSNIPIDHLSGRTTEANSVKNTLILPKKFNPEYINGEYVISLPNLFKENRRYPRP